MGLVKKVNSVTEDDAFSQEEEIFRAHLKRIEESDKNLPNGIGLYKLVNPCLAIVKHLERKETYQNAKLAGYIGFIDGSIDDLERQKESPGKTIGLVARYLIIGNPRLVQDEAKLYKNEELVEQHPDGVIVSSYCDEGSVDLVKDATDTSDAMDYSELEQLMTFLQQPGKAELCIDIIEQAARAYDNDPRNYDSKIRIEGSDREGSYFMDFFISPESCPAHAERYFKLLTTADGEDECEEHPLVLTNLPSVGDA